MVKQAKCMGSVMLLGAAVVLMSFATSAVSQGPGGPMSAAALAEAALHRTVVAGDSWIVDKTTTLKSLKVEEGAALAAPAGYSLTLTVNGVETGIKPGKYQGNIVLTVTDQYIVKPSETLIRHFRQALFLGKDGIVKEKSVLAAAGDYKLNNGVLTGVDIKSVGENFNGILATDGTHTVKDVTIDFTGNGGDDSVGYGAAIASIGKNTRLIVDGANVSTHGAIRTTFFADKGSNLIVKNSHIQAKNGTLPDDYVPNVGGGTMMAVPWMLGLVGNCRATNLMGENTTATYINSDISSEGWGVLSVDAGENAKLTAINSKIAIAGTSGYGSFALSDSVNSFYGSEIEAPDYGVISQGGNAVFGASTPETVARLNADLKLSLTAAELASLTPAQATVKSGRFGVMMWANSPRWAKSTVKIMDGTTFDTGKTIFLIKGAIADIDVDGSKGAQLNSRNGVILQVMDLDDPGPVMVNGLMANKGVYHEPTEAPAKIKDFDLAASHRTDVIAKFSSIALKGDFYNAARSLGAVGVMPGGPGGAAGGPGASSAAPAASGKNMILKFEKANIAGVITASTARHTKDTITPDDYMLLGDVTNTPEAAINNGVIVSLDHSTWTVTGTSYLTSLNIGKGSTVAAAAGKKVAMKVNGKVQPIKAGAYKGEIALLVTP